MRKNDPLFSAGIRSRYRMLREVILQFLFPRACPVCGELLKLPGKWYRVLSDAGPSGKDSPFSVRRLRSIFICSNCIPELLHVAEPFCRKCGRPLEPGSDPLCDICKTKPRYFDRGLALWIHDDAAKKVIYDLKFRGLRDNADLIGLEMALKLNRRIAVWRPETILPVPLHKKRYLERGFNQAELIACRFSFWLEKLYGIHLPVDTGYLFRTENTKPQRLLNTALRSENVRSAFHTGKETAYSGKRKMQPPSRMVSEEDPEEIYRRVLLIDDIFTTGATMDACARALKRSGAQQVFFISASIV